MTNSLIPYSFVPGTKAMASEVNANFIALANAVDEGKTFTTEAIETLEANVETQLEETFATKLEVDLSNSKHISNCILEIPQNIKYEVDESSGRLKLLEGSKVYVSTSGTFDAVTLSYDTAYGAGGLWTPDASRSCFVVYVPSTNTVLSMALDYTFAQTIAPTSFLTGYALWYNPNSNIMKCTVDSGANWLICSLPILVGRPQTVSSGSAGWEYTVDNVFNGMGFFEQYAFLLPGVKYLVPNEKNADGTFKNLIVSTTAVKLSNEANKTSQLMILSAEPNISTYGVNQYFVQDKPPTNFSNPNALWYDTQRNRFNATSNSGKTWSSRGWIIPGRLIKTSAAGRITSMSLTPTFRAVETKEVLDCINSGLYRGTNGGFKLENGLVINWGQTTATTQVVTFTYPFTASNTYQCLVTTFPYYGSQQANPSAIELTSTTAKILSGGATNYNARWVAIGY